MRKSILITGAAGFIGSNLVERLLKEYEDCIIVGIDNLNDYYDVSLKEYRLANLKKYNNFVFVKGNIADKEIVSYAFEKWKPTVVVNLAAQAGVRYSITNPNVYIESNILGFQNILESCREYAENIKHLIFASSSSVYGLNNKVPYSVKDKADSPVSLYAATKKSNELMAHSYSKLYNIPVTGLRFFTVYGPAGRPDMAYFNFTNNLINKNRIKIFNYGDCQRDFTYIDDIIEGVFRVISAPPKKNLGKDGLPIPPYSLYNIGNHEPVNLMDFVNILSEELILAGVIDKDFELNNYMDLVPMQPGDVAVTYADMSDFESNFDYRPQTSLREGLKKFAEWYFSYYQESLNN
ncbi:GDP-mannose 4,6-dehydratase [Enterococcus casseliflavus]|uniref:NAD-dependent epimerase/dehydratase family protein n=1 Tax=Enterococcus casseliflavus TaxID=37734 RepID=A0ABD6YY39_ENTCA|nr:GDP-mannose 4,6-dehydratase [Enterococcus casseliflavus]EOH84870.1 hypothetical protein UAM_00535 [Enterococcus casseliflavus ATCC 49996]EOU10609.1 hypothetical protein I582_01122 [Enterococcus casseliflavus ATCC 49996]MBE9878564.1 NAD-dependent epimerase/dehydratase family protein [Enterococcus casseliflavus]QGN29032.1 NAD-dependent epimerase/dehydratase family protein [Enterococcus casseliflavus]QQB84479.1 GDP-mannose 4,6-dehydratase [Enterococcus casseliflavus]